MKTSARTRGRRRPAKARKGGQSFGRSHPSRPGIQDAGQDCRLQALADFARAARGLKWTKPLFLLLLDELYVGDEFDEIIGPPERLPVALYPGAIAFAVALRNSWRPDDLDEVSRRLELASADLAQPTESMKGQPAENSMPTDVRNVRGVSA